MHALDINAQVAVIGAGAMGAGIAQVAAQAGHPVKLYDNRPGAAAQAIDGIDRQLGRLVEKGKLEAEQRSATVARLQPVEAIEALADARLVIEAIVENLEVKRGLLNQLEALCAADCILASNTSSLSITSLAAGLQHPERVIGMHFFNPAPLMALVEIVSGLATCPELAKALHATAKHWGKQPVHTRSTPGFIVNRVARPFYAESLRLLQEGAADCASLDALLRDAGGFRMGAFELTDLIGHDVNYAVTCSVFAAYYGDFRFQPSLIQKELVDAGRLGRKSGRGFYDYAEGAEPPQAAELTSAAEVASCVVEGDLGHAQVVGIAAQHGRRQMGVAVHQAGHGHHAGAVDDGLGRLLGGLPGDGDDLAPLDPDIGSEEHLHFGIHGHGGDVGDQSIQWKVSFLISAQTARASAPGPWAEAGCTAPGIWDCGSAARCRQAD